MWTGDGRPAPRWMGRQNGRRPPVRNAERPGAMVSPPSLSLSLSLVWLRSYPSPPAAKNTCNALEWHAERESRKKRRGEESASAVPSAHSHLHWVLLTNPTALALLLSSPVQAEPWRVAAWVYQRATFLLANY